MHADIKTWSCISIGFFGNTYQRMKQKKGRHSQVLKATKRPTPVPIQEDGGLFIQRIDSKTNGLSSITKFRRFLVHKIPRKFYGIKYRSFEDQDFSDSSVRAHSGKCCREEATGGMNSTAEQTPGALCCVTCLWSGQSVHTWALLSRYLQQSKNKGWGYFLAVYVLRLYSNLNSRTLFISISHKLPSSYFQVFILLFKLTLSIFTSLIPSALDSQPRIPDS